MASTPILPLAVWQSGTNQNSIPANDNALRLEALNREIISQAVTAQPASPADGDTYIIAATHTGAQWAGFTPGDLAIFKSGTWYAWAPTEGIVINVAGNEFKFDGGVWAASGGGMTNPMSAAGDLIYGGTPSGGVAPPTRLAVGTNGYVLTLAAGIPTWAAATGGFSNPMTTTGDLIYASSGSTPARLGVGSNGTVLTMAGGVPTWAAPSGGAAWGGISGTLASQTDLQAALDAKGAAGVPQNSKSAAYTLVLADANKHIYHPSADTTARIWTIPANASVAFPIGTAVTFDNDNGAGAITIAITTDTLVLVGAGTTGSRTLATGGQATAIKVTATRWRISGVGLT